MWNDFRKIVTSFVYYVAGPGCNLFLRQLNFSIGPFPVDRYTSPGVCCLHFSSVQFTCVMVGMMFWWCHESELKWSVCQFFIEFVGDGPYGPVQLSYHRRLVTEMTVHLMIGIFDAHSLIIKFLLILWSTHLCEDSQLCSDYVHHLMSYFLKDLP